MNTKLVITGLLLSAGLLVACRQEPSVAEPEHGHPHDDEQAEGHGHPHDDEQAEGHGHPHDEEREGTAHEDDHEDEHEGGHGESEEHEAEHAGDERASEVVTAWGDSTQLYVEFDALVIGTPSVFAAHLTRLSDYRAIDEGTVTVELTYSDGSVDAFVAPSPASVGIFKPAVIAKSAGSVQVSLTLASTLAEETHDLGTFTVHESQRRANQDTSTEEPPGDAISFLLEQQWVTPFGITEVEEHTIRPNVPAFGRLTLPHAAAVTISAPRSGRLLLVGDAPPHPGDSIEQGSPLFRLSIVPENDADLASLDAAVEQSAVRVAAAEREVERLTPLTQQGVVPQRRLDEAETALDAAQSAQRSAQRRRASISNSQRIGAGGDSIAIPAPINGTVANVYATPGSWVAQGDELVRVVNQDELWLDVAVPETYIGAIQTFAGAWFFLGNNAEPIRVASDQLVSIGVEVDSRSRTLPVRFRIRNSNHSLYSGTSARVHLISDTPRQALAIPQSAVIRDAGLDVVYVQTGGETFVRRTIILGEQDGSMIEVLSGLHAGDWVVSHGVYAVKLASTSTDSIGHGHAH